ncbi:hypothetical protein BDV26DRAFT_286771 [Aspergillus bertholletiae]|uniref:Uncharacterized protein n=1 Tax=Aspergillus bertholletiae TaxID=1226010 RepID=A0A5N7ANN4_9EURO|nr:hypothetical protein BDV26DRAFT_286771 [Aspergillus bertholletiae]
MADSEQDDSRENIGTHRTILHVSPSAFTYSLVHQHQVPTQEGYTWPASDLQLHLDCQNYHIGHPLMTPPTTQPTIHQHRCHHSVVERQFCIDRMETCNSCGRHPFLGWLYLCVEDTSGFSDPLDPINGPFLSPWMLKAIEDGHYTAEQKEIVIHQKLNVMRMAERERGLVPSPLSMLYAERNTQSGYSQDDPWVDVTRTSEPAVHLDYNGQTSLLLQHPCPSLRRYGNLEERTWISLNPWELLGRPVSDANILRNLELHSRRIGLSSPKQASSSQHGITERRKRMSTRLYSRENITSVNLHELVDQSLHISVRSDQTEQTVSSHVGPLNEVVIEMTMSEFDDHSASFPWPDLSEHSDDEGHNGEQS